MFLTIAAVIAGITALGLAIKIIAYLVIRIVRMYLEQAREKLRNASVRFIARYKDGDYERVSAGIWDDNQSKVTDGNTWQAERLDEELSSIERNEVLILD